MRVVKAVFCLILFLCSTSYLSSHDHPDFIQAKADELTQSALKILASASNIEDKADINPHAYLQQKYQEVWNEYLKSMKWRNTMVAGVGIVPLHLLKSFLYEAFVTFIKENRLTNKFFGGPSSETPEEAPTQQEEPPAGQEGKKGLWNGFKKSLPKFITTEPHEEEHINFGVGIHKGDIAGLSLIACNQASDLAISNQIFNEKLKNELRLLRQESDELEKKLITIEHEFKEVGSSELDAKLRSTLSNQSKLFSLNNLSRKTFLIFILYALFKDMLLEAESEMTFSYFDLLNSEFWTSYRNSESGTQSSKTFSISATTVVNFAFNKESAISSSSLNKLSNLSFSQIILQSSLAASQYLLQELGAQVAKNFVKGYLLERVESLTGELSFLRKALGSPKFKLLSNFLYYFVKFLNLATLFIVAKKLDDEYSKEFARYAVKHRDELLKLLVRYNDEKAIFANNKNLNDAKDMLKQFIFKAHHKENASHLKLVKAWRQASQKVAMKTFLPRLLAGLLIGLKYEEKKDPSATVLPA